MVGVHDPNIKNQIIDQIMNDRELNKCVEIKENITKNELVSLLLQSDFGFYIPQDGQYSISHIIDIMASNCTLITNCKNLTTAWIDGLCIGFEEPVNDILSAVISCEKDPVVHKSIIKRALERAKELSRDRFEIKLLELRKHLVDHVK